MFYVYVLKSQKDHLLYTGATSDLRNRLEKHNKGLIESTKDRKPFDLIYYEACIDKRDAFRREKYLKSSLRQTIYKKQDKRLFERIFHGASGMKSPFTG